MGCDSSLCLTYQSALRNKQQARITLKHVSAPLQATAGSQRLQTSKRQQILTY